MSMTNLLLTAAGGITEVQQSILDIAEKGMTLSVATSFTFFIGCMAMMAASVFFFFEMWNVDKKC